MNLKFVSVSLLAVAMASTLLLAGCPAPQEETDIHVEEQHEMAPPVVEEEPAPVFEEEPVVEEDEAHVEEDHTEEEAY